ncbi:MAG: TlpA family protein disulfide reductase, partial [Anaerolineales bacterium]|nr:TlpA family protein disulfide reductase [Anaerolineales bacterium]
EMGMTYPILLDLDSAVAIRYRVSALPTTFFIDADGVIQEVYPGIINQAVLESRIEQLIRGEEAAGG